MALIFLYMRCTKPANLQKGDAIGIVAPGSPMDKARLARGIDYLKEKGYRVVTGRSIYNERGYLAGTDAERAEDINTFFADPNISAIFCARGGYGSSRLLSKIDYNTIRKNPKIFVGYSDLTSLQLAILAKTSMVTFSGPMVAIEMGSGIHKTTEADFWHMMTDNQPVFDITGDLPLTMLQSGTAKGRILGGCLSIIVTLLGTEFCPDFRGAILFLEDVGEPPYKIDRCFSQLHNAGVLDKIAGILLGAFVNCDPENTGITIDEIISDYTAELDIPVVKDLAYGHIDRKVTIPIGIEAELNTDDGRLSLLESAVE